MKEKILALLVARFQGVRKDCLLMMARALALQASTEDEAKALVDKVTDAQVTEFVKDVRADVDKEVSESNKTFETNLKKKFDFVAKAEPGGNGGKKEPDPNDISEIVKSAVAEAVKPFQEKLSGYEADNIAKSRLQALNEKLNGCKDETFKKQTLKDFARMTFDTDDAFNEYLNEKATDIETANQNVANAALSNGAGSPLFAQKEESGISKGVAEYVESQKPENNSFTGKEV
ncbi:hypothetical protein JCM6292_761 [Bacteroides pyogenes JCM 6292]|uniref:Uncharacterized protein n=2 Tax=Bacteroides pyogenes TaxID=310300 RepID=W4PEI9_9BACE|nr:hypothetical protein [Bacteroides pyogenes]GAE14600.1 hypothetical protein JCM6292_761 [Bacteroides pyogenes JCM 6292]GAE18226.1 hypothetical protein JCM6294_1096 [Bacteroides pyogenes DSM 20611 = JCM 6294]